MRLSGEEYSKRLEEFSYDTLLLMSELMKSTREKAIKMSDITTDSTLTEEQVVEKLSLLLSSHEATTRKAE